MGVFLEDTEIIVHYSEIGLKGKNRLRFENQLIKNIRIKLRLNGLGRSYKIERKRGYIRIYPVGSSLSESKKPRGPNQRDEVSDDSDYVRISDILSKTPGVEYFAICRRIGLRADETDIVLLCDLIDGMLRERQSQGPGGQGRGGPERENANEISFKLKAKRIDKSYPYRSDKINALVGKRLEMRGYRVDYKNPYIIVYIEIHRGFAYVYSEKQKGIGGLPCGVEGKVICLLSGGIDSPVAAWLMLKRGCSVTLLHYYNTLKPHEKIYRIHRILREYDPNIEIITVPFIDLQNEIISVIPAKYRMIIYRRFMLRIAERIARNRGCIALVTGDSLGQVASQTIENIESISRATEMLVFRPLIGFDKQEIIDMAKKVGTYEQSIHPAQECCSYMIGRHPATRSRPELVENLESELEIERLIVETLNRIQS